MSAHPSAEVDRFGRLLALSGVAGPIGFGIVVLVLGALDPNYSHQEHAMSVVAGLGAPFSPIGRLAFVVLGVSVVAFAVGLRRSGAFGERLAPGLVAVHVVGRIGEGVFAFDVLDPTAALNVLHVAFGIPAVLSMIPIPFAIAWVLRDGPSWASHDRYALGVGVLFLVLFILIGPITGEIFGLGVSTGIGQRIAFGLWYLWFVYLAVGLWRRMPAV